jgi:acyl-coenzyme A synthetase/AMP-(fatty) acid ligase
MSSRPGEALPSLRFVTNSGAHLPRSYIDDIKRLYPSCLVFVMFGLTECKRVSIMLPDEYPNKPDAVGRALDQTECIIIDGDGNRLPPGQKGELVVRGPNVMLGYWNAPEQNAKRYRRWGTGHETALFTGDVCSLDADGFLYFHGRNDDIYKQRGHRVSSVEVESAANEVPGVLQAAVIPHRDDEGATLIVTGDTSSDGVLAGLRARLEEFKIPTRVVRSPSDLPLTPNRKVDKKALEQLLNDGQIQ